MDKTIESRASDSTVAHSKRDMLQLFIRPLIILILQSTSRRPTVSTLVDKSRIEILPSYSSMLVILYDPTLMITGQLYSIQYIL